MIAGLLVGEAIVIWLTFSHVYSGHINSGILVLIPNLAVVGVGAILERAQLRQPIEPTQVSVSQP